jgi:DNA (cytosine-5)-methyltransferase 1
MRDDGAGGRAQRAEARFDGLAGCLRTPAGGSSRQTVLWVEGGALRSRLLTPREAARLMGLPDSYRLPARATDAWKLAGDGVAVPLVAFVAGRLLGPLAREAAPAEAARRAS